MLWKASIIGEVIKHDAHSFGWVANAGAAAAAEGGGGAASQPLAPAHDWGLMVSEVQRYIKSLNFQYRVALRDANVKYVNGLGVFEGPHAITVPR